MGDFTAEAGEEVRMKFARCAVSYCVDGAELFLFTLTIPMPAADRRPPLRRLTAPSSRPRALNLPTKISVNLTLYGFDGAPIFLCRCRVRDHACIAATPKFVSVH